MRIKFIGARPSASGVVDYLLDTLQLSDKKVKILGGIGVDLSVSPRERAQQCASNIATSFDIQSSMRPTISKPLLHLSISWMPGEKISDEQMMKAAKTTLHWLGLDGAQRLLVRHDERPHPHMHILVNTIMADGKVKGIPHPPWLFFRDISLNLTFENHWKRGVHKSLSKADRKNRKKRMAIDKAKMQVARLVFQALCQVQNVEDIPEIMSRITNGKTTAEIQMSYSGGESLPEKRIVFHHYDDEGKEHTFEDKYWDWHYGYDALQDVLIYNNEIVQVANEVRRVLDEYAEYKKYYIFSKKYERAEKMLKITLANLNNDNQDIKELLKTDQERRIYLTMMHYRDLRYYCDILRQGISRKESAKAKRIKEFNYIKEQNETKKRRRQTVHQRRQSHRSYEGTAGYNQQKH